MMGVTNTGTPEHRLVAIICDIARYRLYKPVQTECSNTDHRLFFPLRFVNKGIDKINISNIFHNKQVKDKIPPYFKFQEPPIVSYSYSKTIGRKLFNYNKVLKNLDYSNISNTTCNCMSSPFCYKPIGHVITGDFNIVDDKKLRQLFQFGPKYREPPKVNWNLNFKIIMDAAEAYARKWAVLEEVDVECLSDWLSTVRDKVKARILRLRSSCAVTNTRSAFGDLAVCKCLDALHDEYVVFPADKASNNIIFVCKSYYIQCLVNELKLHSDEQNNTYSLSTLCEEDIFRNHSSVLREFGISLASDDNVLPSLYWIPKIHKNPYKQRFIAGSSKCTTKRLSHLLTIILTTIKNGLVRYCDKVYETSGLNQMWILKNSKELLETLQTTKIKYTSIRTFDFSTLYTTIPHDKLKSRISLLVKQAFFHKNGSRRYQYIVITSNKGYFSNNTDAKHKYTDEEIIKMLHFLIDNIFIKFAGMVFRQTVGIPMGTNCAPLLADLFLYSYEAEFIQSLNKAGRKNVAKRFINTYRYIDDLISLNNPTIANYLDHIYPDELEIKETTESADSASYLDLFIQIRHHDLHTKLYDKRDDFNFEIINFPYLSSNIPSAPAYGVYVSQLLRYCRACESYDDFRERHSLLAFKLVRQGFSVGRLASSFKKFYGRYRSMVSKYDTTVTQMMCDSIPNFDLIR